MSPFRLFIIASFLYMPLCAQIGGKNGFEFINYPGNAKLSGIGGMNVSSKDSDPNMIFSNPALLSKEMHNWASVSYNRYYADIWHSNVAYAFDTKKLGSFGAGMQYTEFGRATATDETGNILGTTFANEYAFVVTKSHTIGNYTLGANAKLAHSQIAGLTAMMGLIDMGGVFKHPTRQFTIGLLIKNIGGSFKNYVPGQQVVAPFDVQAGFTYKLEHMPLRFSLTAHHLHRWDIAYDDPNRITGYDLNGNPQYERVGFVDNLARHFVLGGEFILAKGFHIRAGYNHFRRREMNMDNYSGLGGFSFGAMLRIKRLELGYTTAFYHAAGARNFFTVMVNIAGRSKSFEVPLTSPQ